MYRKLSRFLRVVILLVLAGYLWYNHLDENHQRFVKNLLRQLPELPGRYLI